MWLCPVCKKENIDNAKKCLSCGKGWLCPNCKNPMSGDCCDACGRNDTSANASWLSEKDYGTYMETVSAKASVPDDTVKKPEVKADVPEPKSVPIGTKAASKKADPKAEAVPKTEPAKPASGMSAASPFHTPDDFEDDARAVAPSAPMRVKSPNPGQSAPQIMNWGEKPAAYTPPQPQNDAPVQPVTSSPIPPAEASVINHNPVQPGYERHPAGRNPKVVSAAKKQAEKIEAKKRKQAAKLEAKEKKKAVSAASKDAETKKSGSSGKVAVTAVAILLVVGAAAFACYGFIYLPGHHTENNVNKKNPREIIVKSDTNKDKFSDGNDIIIPSDAFADSAANSDGMIDSAASYDGAADSSASPVPGVISGNNQDKVAHMTPEGKDNNKSGNADTGRSKVTVPKKSPQQPNGGVTAPQAPSTPGTGKNNAVTPKPSQPAISPQQSAYNTAKSSLNTGNYFDAYNKFRALGSYSDSKRQLGVVAQKVGTYLSSGYNHTIGLRKNGTLVAVGNNDYGKSDICSWQNIVAVSARGRHSVGLRTDGTLIASGDNSYGQCNVGGFKGVSSVSAGAYHTLALTKYGTAVAVGDNANGQCEVYKTSWSNLKQVSAGAKHSVALKSDGTVIAVGDNEYGQCNVSGWKDIIQISAGDWYTIGLKSDGTVVSTGYNNYGQRNVSGWSDIVYVSAGLRHTVGLKSDGTVVSVGVNKYGECDLSSWKNIVSVSAGGYYYTTAITSDGRVLVAGDDSFGQKSATGISGVAK